MWVRQAEVTGSSGDYSAQLVRILIFWLWGGHPDRKHWKLVLAAIVSDNARPRGDYEGNSEKHDIVIAGYNSE